MKYNAELDLTINSGNAAFADGNAANETAHILREIATKIENGETRGKTIDSNGNTVGKWTFDAGGDAEEEEDD